MCYKKHVAIEMYLVSASIFPRVDSICSFSTVYVFDEGSMLDACNNVAPRRYGAVLISSSLRYSKW